MSEIDNFDRQVWAVVGATLEFAVMALGGWPSGLGFLAGWGLGSLLLFALLTGRIALRKKPRQESRL